MKDDDEIIRLTPYGLLSTEIGMPAAEAAVNTLEKFCRKTGQALAVDRDGVFRFVELRHVPPAPTGPVPIKDGDRAWLKMKVPIYLTQQNDRVGFGHELGRAAQNPARGDYLLRAR